MPENNKKAPTWPNYKQLTKSGREQVLVPLIKRERIEQGNQISASRAPAEAGLSLANDYCHQARNLYLRRCRIIHDL